MRFLLSFHRWCHCVMTKITPKCRKVTGIPYTGYMEGNFVDVRRYKPIVFGALSVWVETFCRVRPHNPNKREIFFTVMYPVCRNGEPYGGLPFIHEIPMPTRQNTCSVVCRPTECLGM